MKSEVKAYLRTCDSARLTPIIVLHSSSCSTSCSQWCHLVVPQSFYDTSSWKTPVKGMYFLAGLLTDITGPAIKPVGYVGQATGIEGLKGRCSEHHDEKARLRDLRRDDGKRGKLLYKYIEGLVDGAKRTIRTVAIATFSVIPANAPPLEVLYDIVEAVFMILLDTSDRSRNIHEIDTYTALRPPTFVCEDDFIPTNRIIPLPAHITGKVADKGGDGNDAADLAAEREAIKDRYDCGFSHEETTNIEFMGLGDSAIRRASR